MSELGDRTTGVQIDLSPEEESRVPFGRSRFLKAMSASLFGAVTGIILRAEPAQAAPYPCYGYDACQYCNGRICNRYCRAPYRTTCPTPNGQCWNVCDYSNSRLYRCCDWVDTRIDRACICVEPWGQC